MKQVAYHFADDHMNSYVRFKLALTENEPAINPYGEAQWAELPDARLGSIEPSPSARLSRASSALTLPMDSSPGSCATEIQSRCLPKGERLLSAGFQLIATRGTPSLGCGPPRPSPRQNVIFSAN